jgi:hypothetical protein
VRVQKGAFLTVQQQRNDRSVMDAGEFRALVATTWTGIGKRAVQVGLICLFLIALPPGVAKPV